MGVLLSGEFYHLQPMIGLNDFFCHFMGREGSRYEDHFVKAEGFSNLFCSPEVTEMDGIECPPEKPDPSLFSLLFNLRLPLILDCRF